MSRRPAILVTLLLSALTLAASGCKPLPVRYGRNVRVLPASGLREANPAEVVVAPVVGGPELEAGARFPGESLRAALYDDLPRKRYSPLGLDFVDDRVATEASYRPGACDEDAVLQVIVHRWDDSLWAVRQALDVDLEVRLVSAREEATEPLWAVRLDQRFDFGGKADSFATPESQLAYACSSISWEILSTLPARQARPGPR